MNSILLKPIGRRTYFVGLLVISFIGTGLVFLVMRNGALPDPASLSMKALPFTLLLGLVGLVWDYKRIKDISVNPVYMFLLIIPLASMLVNILMKNSSQGNMLQSFPMTEGVPALMGLFGIFSFIYRLFLIFKKGRPQVATTPQV